MKRFTTIAMTLILLVIFLIPINSATSAYIEIEPVAAGGTVKSGTLKVSSVTVNTKDAFDITVSIEDNPGLCFLNFELTFDTDAFVFVDDGIVCSDEVFNAIGFADFDDDAEYGSHTFKYNGYYYSEKNGENVKPDNTTANGNIVTIRLQPIEGVIEEKDYNIGISISDINTINTNKEKISVKYPAEAVITVTSKTTPQKPAAPTLAESENAFETKTNNSVTLKAIDGCEYSMDGSTWQDSNVFTNLDADTTYNFYCRVKATDKSYASETSDALQVTTYKRGDMDGSGSVDSDDAIYLLRHTLNSEKYPMTQDGNVDGIGQVDSDDAIYLLRHTLNKDKYPLK